jgi:hypothetical protein
MGKKFNLKMEGASSAETLIVTPIFTASYPRRRISLKSEVLLCASWQQLSFNSSNSNYFLI